MFEFITNVIPYIPNQLNGIHMAPKKNTQNGDKNPCWRGGRVKNCGYILIYSPSHPHIKFNRPYIFEHRLVMEKQLGRYLEKGEVVHHINGIKDDNRIENLQLFRTDSEHHIQEWENGTYPPPQGRKLRIKSISIHRWRSQEDKNNVIILYSEGLTYREISVKIGISIGTISAWLKIYGKKKYSRRLSND